MDDRLDMVEETRHEYWSCYSQIKVFYQNSELHAIFDGFKCISGQNSKHESYRYMSLVFTVSISASSE